MRRHESKLIEIHPKGKAKLRPTSSSLQRRGSVSSLSSIGSIDSIGSISSILYEGEEEQTIKDLRWSFNQETLSEHSSQKALSPPSPVNRQRPRHWQSRRKGSCEQGFSEGYDSPPSHMYPYRDADGDRDNYFAGGRMFFESFHRFSGHAALGQTETPSCNGEARWSRIGFNKANCRAPPSPVEKSVSVASSDQLGRPPQRKSSLVLRSGAYAETRLHIPSHDESPKVNQKFGSKDDQGRRLIEIIQKLSIRAAMALTRSSQCPE
jgi:hypothetical protein